MVNNLDDKNTKSGMGTEAVEANTWHLNALSEALGDLTLTVSDSLSVGRGSDNDVVLGSKQVSRNHALLSVLNGKLYMKDLDSSNGTFINDERIEANQSMALVADDNVGFASFVFQVKKPVAAAINAEVIDNISIDTTPMAVANEEVPDAEISQLISPPAALDSISSIEVQPAISSPVEPVVEEETVIGNTLVDDGLSADDILSKSKTDEPVIKETMIGEVLSSTTKSTTAPATNAVLSETSAPNMTTGQEPVILNDTDAESLNKELLSSKSVMKESLVEEPLAVEPTLHQEAVIEPQKVSPEKAKTEAVSQEQDKTTKTALQEEADPDILRAKQAATGQFSGTTNLSQSRDIGTEGNNALDQAIISAANVGHIEKKPSGSWFIWVFIVMIIIGVALWLFNMGGV